MQVYKGLLEPRLLSRFPSGFPEDNGFDGYVSNCVGLEGVLSCAALFSPDFIEHESSILIGGNIDGGDESKISTRFGSGKDEIEKYNNLICLSEFFLHAEDEACDDEELVVSFGRVLIHYWKLRLRDLFPLREFEFLLDNDLFDEDGVCITFFEVGK